MNRYMLHTGRRGFHVLGGGEASIFASSILRRLADVISDTDKGNWSLRARKFASGKRL